MAARSRLPRLHLDRGDLVRDEERVPGPRAGGPDAARGGHRILRCALIVAGRGSAREPAEAAQ